MTPKSMNMENLCSKSAKLAIENRELQNVR